MKLPEPTVNEIMETITTDENNTNSKELIHEPPNEEEQMNLLEQYSNFTPTTPDWQGADTTVVISEASIQGKSATYHVTVQDQPTIVLLDTEENISVIFQKTFWNLVPKTKIIKITYTYSHIS